MGRLARYLRRLAWPVLRVWPAWAREVAAWGQAGPSAGSRPAVSRGAWGRAEARPAQPLPSPSQLPW